MKKRFRRVLNLVLSPVGRLSSAIWKAKGQGQRTISWCDQVMIVSPLTAELREAADETKWRDLTSRTAGTGQ
ncbi:unnamed protein product [Pieris macdunnoughi]|uniref:Uncharacterized protein n=1 Tax=Pieris macdunnoughi TaxID=345717 RepID=A0A821TR14_9NEOP|nr:unnamed protein product [Pieris macdunnoughi]